MNQMKLQCTFCRKGDKRARRWCLPRGETPGKSLGTEKNLGDRYMSSIGDGVIYDHAVGLMRNLPATAVFLRSPVRDWLISSLPRRASGPRIRTHARRPRSALPRNCRPRPCGCGRIAVRSTDRLCRAPTGCRSEALLILPGPSPISSEKPPHRSCRATDPTPPRRTRGRLRRHGC